MKSGAILSGVAALGAVAALSCTAVKYTVALPPAVEGAHFVGNKVCYDCHTNITRSFPSSVHARLHFEGAGMREQTGCESCHGPGSKHVAFGGGRGVAIVNPGRNPEGCYQCHFETHAEFSLPQHHPLPEGKMQCVQCHDPHGRDIMKPSGGLAMARLNQTCASCHRDQSRTFAYVHEALREGCVACHQPHGSINSKMLVFRDNNLCLRCHAQVASPILPSGTVVIGSAIHAGIGLDRIVRGTCWSSGCHTAVHGSNIDPKLRF